VNAVNSTCITIINNNPGVFAAATALHRVRREEIVVTCVTH
jgi:hypothetical protein